MNTEILENKKLWVINFFLKLWMSVIRKKRKQNIWVFGSWLGEKYTDNSKYFFEYIINNHKDITPIWITKNSEVKKKLLQNKYQVYLSTEKKAIKILKEAGVIIYTNSIYDVCEKDYSIGAYKVALWHGMPLKKIYFASNKYKKSKLKYLKKLKFLLYSDVYRNLTISTSDYTKELLEECFKTNKRKIIVSGQPRNEIILGDLKKEKELKNKLKIKTKEKIVLYLPTWRRKEQEKEFEDKITLLLEDLEYRNNLKKEQIKIIVKFHPLFKNNYKSNENIIFINDEIETQELLLIGDMLVTDYSSVFIDFALRNKPILFYTFDYEDYKKSDEGVFLNIEMLTDKLYLEDKEIKKAILDNFIEMNKLETTNKINSYYNDTKKTGTKFCENVYVEIKKRIRGKNK